MLRKNIFGSLLARLVSLIFIVLLVRYLEISQLGKLAFVLSWLTLPIALVGLRFLIGMKGDTGERTVFVLSSMPLLLGFSINGLMLILLKGWYNLAFYFPLFFLLGILGVVGLSPKFFSGEENSPSTKDYAHNLKYMFLLVFPLSTFLAFEAPRIIPFLLGDKFTTSCLLPIRGYTGEVFAFQIIIWTLNFLYFNLVHYRMAIVIQKKRIIGWGILNGVVVGILLNLWLIPLYGFQGACISTLVMEVIIFLTILFFFQKEGIRIPLRKAGEKPLIATLGLAIILHYFQVHHLPFWLILPLSVLGYFIILILLLTFSKKELEQIRAWLVLER